MSTDPLLRFRPQFPGLEGRTWLVSHSLGAMPRAAAEELARYGREWTERGVRAWEDAWWTLPGDAGDELAPLIGAAPGSVVLQPNATLAAAVLLSALDFAAPRDGLVTTALDFPSLLYLYRGQRERGARVLEVPSRDGIRIDPERLLAAIDERTRLVAVSHVLFRSAFVQDAAVIAARAREVGALFVLDLYQSAGSVPVDLAAIGADAAFGGCLKWLCGGPGNGFLYVRPDRIAELRPRLTGWQAHEEPFAFDSGELRAARGIGRFLHGTPGIPAMRAALAGIRAVKEAGIGAIRAKSLRQTQRILDRCAAEGWEVNTPLEPERRGGSVVFRPPHHVATAREAIEHGVLLDHRPDAGIRLGPHFYNTDEEIDRAMDVIAGISAERACRS
jgi:kynureninase